MCKRKTLPSIDPDFIPGLSGEGRCAGASEGVLRAIMCTFNIALLKAKNHDHLSVYGYLVVVDNFGDFGFLKGGNEDRPCCPCLSCLLLLASNHSCCHRTRIR